MKLSTISIFCVIFIFIGTINSFACSCDDQTSVSESIKYTDVVFNGKVISKVITSNFDSLEITSKGDTNQLTYNWREFPIMAVQLEVIKIYLGQLVFDTLTILTPASGRSCGFQFEIGENYIVYGTDTDDFDRFKRKPANNKSFWTHSCTRTQHWNWEEENELFKETEQNQVRYFPQQYEELKTDSILDQKLNLNVSIIRKTLMNESVSIIYTDENEKTITDFYRDYSSEIIVYKSDLEIFKRTFKKTDFEQIGDDEFLKEAILYNTWIQAYDKKNKTVKISLVIGVPETDWAYHFTLFIEENGDFHSELDQIK